VSASVCVDECACVHAPQHIPAVRLEKAPFLRPLSSSSKGAGGVEHLDVRLVTPGGFLL